MRPFGDPGGDYDLAVGLSRDPLPDRRPARALRDRRRDPQHVQPVRACPALTPVAWNLVIIVGLVLGVPRGSTTRTRSSTSTPASSLLGTLVQVLLPIPWLRGLDGRLHVVIDWRDPAVKRVFVLMLPVTLGLGLINFNSLDRHAVRVAAHRPGARAGRDRQGLPPLHASAGDLRRRGRDGALPDARRGSPRARRLGGLPRHASAAACARSRSCSSRRASSRPCSRSRSSGSCTSAASSRPTDDRVVAGALAAFSVGLVFNGGMLMLNRGVLQPADELDPDRHRARRTSR